MSLISVSYEEVDFPELRFDTVMTMMFLTAFLNFNALGIEFLNLIIEKRCSKASCVKRLVRRNLYCFLPK